MEYLYLIGGLAVLLLSGDFLVRGGVGLARQFKISKLVIGVTVVSFGTSAPELIVSINAALSGHPEISIGNVVGSNIANIGLVLGLTAILLPLPVKSNSILFDWPYMMGASLLFWLFAYTSGALETWEGILFCALLVTFILVSIRMSRKQFAEEPDNHEKMPPLGKSLLFVIAASVGLYFGSEWLVKGAVDIASSLGVSKHVISVTIIAFGTSVPELATSIIAVFKKETDISIGNIIGSNLFNLLGILGVTSIVKSIGVSPGILKFDIYWMLGIAVLLFVFILPPGKSKISRWKGAILLLGYICYIYFNVN